MTETLPEGNSVKSIETSRPVWARPLIYGNVIISVYLYLITEVLSCFHLLTRRAAAVLWLIFLIAAVLAGLKRRTRIRTFIRGVCRAQKLSITTVLQLCIAITLVFVMCFLAWNIVPYNWDSMTYHCSRVANWIQNQSVAYYPTNNPRQLYSPPFAEYVVLHSWFLFGSDRAFNMVQWYAYTISAVTIYAICRELGIKKEIALTGSLLALTMPIAVAESTTTQTDLVAAAWLLFFIYIVIDFSRKERIELTKEQLSEAAAAGCIAGIGYLSKSQICLIMAILFVWLVIVRVRKKDRFRDLAAIGGAALLCTLPFLLPTFIRNYQYTGDILAAEYFSDIAAGSQNPRYLLLNAFKNWAQTSISYVNPAYNEKLLATVHRLADALGVPVDDPLISFGSLSFDPYFATSYHCDTASAPFVAIGFSAAAIAGIVFCIVVRLWKKEKPDHRNRTLLALFLVISAAVSFSEVRWQPWITRLLLPTYMVMILFIIIVSDSIAGRMGGRRVIKVSALVMSLILLGTACPAAAYQRHFYEDYKEAGDRLPMYFANRGEYPQYYDLMHYVKEKGFSEIGVYLGLDTYEYPLWVGLKNSDTRIIQVVPDDANAAEVPECIIAIHAGGFALGQDFKYLGNTYTCTFSADESDEYTVLEREGT